MKRVICYSMLTGFLATAVLAIALTGPVEATSFPGPDAFGYRGTVIAHTLRDISNSGTFMPLFDDQVSIPLPIGFTFSFYGSNYTTFQISSNGFINLGAGNRHDGCCSGHSLPSAPNPNNIIAGWWEDLNAPQGNIRYQTLGSAPNRQLVVGFYNVPHYFQGVPVTFEIVLHEGSNNIEIQCAECISDGDTHTIGIENASGSIGLEVFRGQGSQIQQGWLLSANQQLAVVAVSASDFQAPNVPANTLDQDLGTRWSALGDGQWIEYDLGSPQTVNEVRIAWYRGDERQAHFDLEVSWDAETWTEVFSGSSSGATLELQRYSFDDVRARYVRIVGHGNTENDWNSITEVEMIGRPN